MYRLPGAVALIALTVGLLLAGTAITAQTPALNVPSAAEASPAFDPARATEAYLALVPPEQRARSDAYFEGSNWLQLWSSLYTIFILGLLLALGWSSRIRELAVRITNRRPLQTLIYWVLFVLYVSVVSFPLTVYSGFYREHQYGLATQTFWPWMNEQLIGLAVLLVLGGLGMIVLYAVLRRVGRAWWLWATGVAVVFQVCGAMIAPVFIAPLFNSYTPLADSRVREPILRMARANGITVHAVYVVDQSRQTTRVSANVSGLLGTTRISLNDNLLGRASLEEIEMVMGHEMGHYVLNHVITNLVEVSLLMAMGLALSARAFEWLRQRRPRWGIESSADIAGLPLIVALLTLYFLFVTPLTNTITRTSEYEADLFGLNVSRQPDGLANVTLKLGEYRKLSPGPIEEFMFFDHPSGRTRIATAMRWKGETLDAGRSTR
jgi:STE24 endopeptidase